MAFSNSEVSFYDLVEGRNIVKSWGIGKWKPEDVDGLSKGILKLAKGFGGAEWAYIADPSKMAPILTKETSEAFVKLHHSVEAAGCKAIAFLDGDTAAMKLQSQKHQDKSDSKMVVLHFNNEAEALDWLKNMGI